MLSHDNLTNFYTVNFTLNQDFNISITELENMIPYEREIYIYMIMNKLKEERERAKAHGT